jgi:hypothetical protein
MIRTRPISNYRKSVPENEYSFDQHLSNNNNVNLQSQKPSTANNLKRRPTITSPNSIRSNSENKGLRGVSFDK